MDIYILYVCGCVVGDSQCHAMRLRCLHERVDTSQRERDRPTETYRETERESQNRRQTNADPEISGSAFVCRLFFHFSEFDHFS